MTGCGMGRQRRRLSWRGGGIWCTLAEGLSGSNHGRGGRTEGEKHEGLSSGQGKSPAKMKGKKKKKILATNKCVCVVHILPWIEPEIRGIWEKSQGKQLKG